MTTMLDTAGNAPPQTFVPAIQAVTADPFRTSDAAADIARTVLAAANPATALWELWDAFFMRVATAPATHGALRALLDALRALPAAALPTDAARQDLCDHCSPDGKLDWAHLPRFDWQWRDAHDALQASRDDRARDVGAKFLCFCTFSAALVAGGTDEVQAVWAFFACREALEREGPRHWEEESQRPFAPKERLRPEELWALDVGVAAAWMREAGPILVRRVGEGFGEYWARGVAQKTDLWQERSGFVEGRWKLWVERFESLSAETRFDEETRAAAKEAAQTARGLLS